MKLLPDPVCKRIANLWALANDPGGSAHECAVAREMLRKLQAELRLSDFMLVYLLEREQKSRGEFDPIEIMIYLFEEARIQALTRTGNCGCVMGYAHFRLPSLLPHTAIAVA